MKIEINYDLLSKIKESKTGFSLDKTTKHIMWATAVSTAVGLIINFNKVNPIIETIKLIPGYILINGMLRVPVELGFSRPNRIKCISELILLSQKLRDSNMNTDYELLLESYKYETKYKLGFDESLIPYVKQDKYIMVPIYDNGEEKEVSLLQEHVIGSNKYYLSYGSPKKVLKLAFGSI